MTFDSAPPSAAAATAEAETDRPDPFADAANGDEDVSALAALLADPSTVSSEEIGSAASSAAPPGAAAVSAHRAPSGGLPLDRPRAAARAAHAAGSAPEFHPADPAPAAPDPAPATDPDPSPVPAADGAPGLGRTQPDSCADGSRHAAGRAGAHDSEGDMPRGDVSGDDVIYLSDRTGRADAQAGSGLDDSFLQDIADAPSVSFGEDAPAAGIAGPEAGEAPGRQAGPVETPNPAAPPAMAPAPPNAASIATAILVPGDEPATPAASTGRDPATVGAPEPPAGQASPGDGADDPGPPPGDAGAADAPSLRAGTAAPEPGPAFDDALLRDIAAAPSVSSSDGAGPAAGASVIPVAVPDRDDDAEDLAAAPPAPAADPGFDETLRGSLAGAPDAAADPLDAVHGDIPLEAAPPGPAAALAFATDHDTEVALRDGLFGYRSASPGCGDPQVWQGGLRAAIAALGEGHSAPLVFVDIDGIPYPAGAMHELAAVCEEGTVVVAVGSDGTARPGRELLLAGVSDYLAKPLTADAVRVATGRAAADAIHNRPGGRVAGFVGSGGSGTTTLVSAAALHAAERGCYVSVLDLNRSVAAAALALGIEPAAGLDQLLEAAGQAMAEPEMVEGVCARRSDRIEVYAHPWTPAPPAAPFPVAVDRVLAALRLRSQLVLVDGLDETEMRFDAPSEIDTRVFVAEPTAGKAAHLPRMLDMLGNGTPLLFVQNHTRAFKRAAAERALRDANLGIEPDVVVPFESSLPGTTDRGWPDGRLPHSLRKPVAALTDRLLTRTPGAGAAAPAPGPGGS